MRIYQTRFYWVSSWAVIINEWHSMTKPTIWHVCPAKTQISLGIRPVWSESSLCTHWVARVPTLLHADSEDSDQTERIPRLIWVFAGHTGHFVGFVMQQFINITLFTPSKRSAILYIRNQPELAHRSRWARKYNLHYDEVWGDFLGPPHMHLTPSAVKINWVLKRRSFGSKEITQVTDSGLLSYF